MSNARVLAVAALAAAGCATNSIPGQPLAMRAPAVADEPAPGFTRQGEIVYTPAGSAGSSAAWNGRSVRGPAVNLTLTDQGLWGGTIQERAVLLSARNGRITGEGVDLFVNQEGDTVHVQGLWFSRMLRIEVSPRELSASPFAGVCGMELAPGDDGYWRGFGGCGGRVDLVWMRLRGVAADPAAEMPQWFFAFLAALPSVNASTISTGGGVGPGVVATPGYFLAAEYRGPPQWLVPPPWQFTCYPPGSGGYPSCLTTLSWRGDWDVGGVGVQGAPPRPGMAGGGGARSAGMRPSGGDGVRTAAARPPGVPGGRTAVARPAGASGTAGGQRAAGGQREAGGQRATGGQAAQGPRGTAP